MNHFKYFTGAWWFALVLTIGTANLDAQDVKTPTAPASDRAWLWSELKQQKTFDHLETLQKEDVNQFEKLLIETLAELKKPKQAIAVKPLQDRWAVLNWQLHESPSSEMFVLREHPDHRYGRGAYAFRTAPPSRIALQAPHRFNDLMTGSIAIKLFHSQTVSAIALNTIHRSAIDLSHTNLHFFNAFTSAMIKAHQGIAILQIHGFTNQGKTGAAKSSSIIVSDGTKFPGRSARQTALELKATFGAGDVRLFPVDIRQLGGTTNRQATIAHGLGCPNFLHLELNRDFRAKLDADASVRASIFDSVSRGLSN